MSELIKRYIDDYFGALIFKFDFELKIDLASDESLLVEYVSESYLIKLEKYRREFYPSVCSIFDQENEINLFNLLSFLKQDDSNAPKSDFFRKEKNIEDSYKKQLNNISSAIYENLNLLNNFFSEDKYKRNALEFHNYWKSKHPELYRTI